MSRDYAQKRREETLQRIDSSAVRWFLKPFPPGLFIGEYWVGLLTGLILGVLYHTLVIAINTEGPIPI